MGQLRELKDAVVKDGDNQPLFPLFRVRYALTSEWKGFDRGSFCRPIHHSFSSFSTPVVFQKRPGTLLIEFRRSSVIEAVVEVKLDILELQKPFISVLETIYFRSYECIFDYKKD